MQTPPTVEQSTPQPTQPTAPTLPTPSVGGPVIVTLPPAGQGLLTRAEVAAIRARREELSDQLTSAASRRNRLADELRTADPAARQGLEQRIAVLDERIVRLEQDIAETGRQLTSRGFAETLAPISRSGFRSLDSGQITAISIVFTVLVLFPIAIAYARQVWKRATGAYNPAAATETAQRLSQLEQAVDTVAVEMERVSEGQRFITKLLMEPNALASLEAGHRAPDALSARGEPARVRREGT